MKKYLIIILILAIIGIAFIIWRLPARENGPDILLGGDRDEHGCIGSAGYSWCESKQKCLRIFEEDCPDETAQSALIQELRELFILKYGASLSGFNISISQQDSEHVRGDIVFLDKDQKPAAGGYFFAAKIGGKWQIILDGNGEIPCDLAEYGFPGEMLQDCVAK